jgi:hypothetical protein
MGVTNGLKKTTLGVNVFTAPGKTMVGERPKPFGEPFGLDPATSTLADNSSAPRGQNKLRERTFSILVRPQCRNQSIAIKFRNIHGASDDEPRRFSR